MRGGRCAATGSGLSRTVWVPSRCGIPQTDRHRLSVRGNPQFQARGDTAFGFLVFVISGTDQADGKPISRI